MCNPQLCLSSICFRIICELTERCQDGSRYADCFGLHTEEDPQESLSDPLVIAMAFKLHYLIIRMPFLFAMIPQKLLTGLDMHSNSSMIILNGTYYLPKQSDYEMPSYDSHRTCSINVLLSFQYPFLFCS